MVDYANPIRERIQLDGKDFGNSTLTFTHRGPKGKRGIVRDIEALVTTAMVGTSTVPEVDVGTGSGDTSYARFRLGTAAGTGYGTGVKRARPLCTTGNGLKPTLSDFTGHVALETDFLPADTDYVITLKAGTGGSPAGVADVAVVIEWF
jgi:hypothetical protein